MQLALDISGGRGERSAKEVQRVVKIQAAVRGRIVRRALTAAQEPVAPVNLSNVQLALEASSATRIQAVFMGRRVRKILVVGSHESALGCAIANEKEEDLEDAKETTSAVRIQAAFRGIHARRVLAAQWQTSMLANDGGLGLIAEGDHRVSISRVSLPFPSGQSLQIGVEGVQLRTSNEFIQKTDEWRKS